MARIEGLDRARARLRGLGGSAAERKLGQALFAAGEMIAVEAQISLTTGAGSGGRHIPSAPGEAPNQQTGVLGGNIEAVQVAIDEVHVTSSAPYSAALEWGTSKMGERPFMRPALEKKRKEARQLIARAARSLSR